MDGMETTEESVLIDQAKGGYADKMIHFAVQ